MSHTDQLQVLLKPCNQSRYRQEADRRDPTPSSEVDLQLDKVFSNGGLYRWPLATDAPYPPTEDEFGDRMTACDYIVAYQI
jgi:hypothetical protein